LLVVVYLVNVFIVISSYVPSAVINSYLLFFAVLQHITIHNNK